MIPELISFHVSDQGIFTLTLNRPDKHNAFNDRLIAELLYALEQADRPEVRAILVRGAGKHFCAGADLAWMQRMVNLSFEENLQDARQLATLLRTLNEHPKPVIAVAHGSAFGGAIGLIACADIAIATPNARFALSEVKLGLIPATISPFVIDAIGARRCRKLFLTGESFCAEEALEYGLVHEVVAQEQLEQRLAELAHTFATLPPKAVAEAKRLIHQVIHPEPRGSVYEFTCHQIAQLRIAPEGQEGLQAFLEKRPPQWPKEPPAEGDTP